MEIDKMEMDMELEKEMEMAAPRIQRIRSYERFDDHELTEMGLHLPLDYDSAKRELQNLKRDLPRSEMEEEEEEKKKKKKNHFPTIVVSPGKSTTKSEDKIKDLTMAKLEDLSDQLRQWRKFLKHLEPEKIASIPEQQIEDLEVELIGLRIEDPPSCPASWSEQDTMARWTDYKTEKDTMAAYRRSWESTHGDDCGKFEYRTSLGSMLFTHFRSTYMPMCAITSTTLQFYSIRLVRIKEDIGWPLDVHGMVAARDHVDHNRNVLFLRKRNNCQTLTEMDSTLRLTGPSRAIVFLESVHFEIHLEVKGPTVSEDRVLMTRVFSIVGTPDISPIQLSNDLCTVELSLQQHDFSSVQATILSVQVVEGLSAWPFQNGVLVFSSTEASPTQFLLLDARGEAMPIPPDGYLDLSRCVIAADICEKLIIQLEPYSPSGEVGPGRCVFRPRTSGISKGLCMVGNCKVEVTVGWSLLIHDKRDILERDILY